MATTKPEPLSLAELAARGGVSRRTVRYYVQRGLLPRPTGVGRGSHYTEAHLARLKEVRAQQERGVPLAAILAGAPAKRDSSGRGPVLSLAAGAADSTGAEPSGAAWFRSALAPGVELHVRGRRLSPTTLEALRHVLRAHDDTQEGEPR